MFGKFNEDFGLQIDSSTTVEKIPFGDREWWDDEDLSTSTNVEFEYDDTLIIDLSFDNISNKTIEDLSGNNNIGILISDYQISFDEETQKPSSHGISNTPRIGKIKKGKAF